MPYTIKENSDNEFCVYKKGDDGEAMGDSIGCHKTKKEATAQIGAIESKENKKMADVRYLEIDNTVTLSNINWDSWTDNITGMDSTGWYTVKSDGNVVPLDEIPFKEEPVNDEFAIKSLGGGRVGGYAMIWGDEDNKDLHGEFFTPDTKDVTTLFDEIGVLPFIVHHAADDGVKKFVGGAIDVLEPDDIGLWFEAKTKEFEAYSTYVKPLIKKKMLFPSSGTLPGAKRKNVDTGEITRWVMAEVSGTWTPAEYRMLEHPLNDIKSAFAELGVDFPEEESPEDNSEKTNEATLGAEKAQLKALVQQELLKLGLLELD